MRDNPKIRAIINGAFYFGLSEIFVCQMERYFPPDRTDLVPFQLEHVLVDKMLKDHGKVAVLSIVSCFMERNLTLIRN